MLKFDLRTVKAAYKQLPTAVTAPLFMLPFSVFCGRAYRHQLADLKAYAQMSDAARKTVQQQKLITYCNEAITHTAFYRDVARRLRIDRINDIRQLEDFPLVDKEQLQQELARFLDPRFEKHRYEVTTGGTTGAQTRLYFSNDCYSREWAFINDYLQRNGVDTDARRLCLRGVEGIPPQRLTAYNPLYKELLISPFRLNAQTLAQNLVQIRKFRPRWIHGYPSSVCELARALSQNKASLPSVTHILLVSEAVHADQLALLSSVFNCKILSFYGMTERVCFAERNDEYFVPHPLYGITELINGELVATGFLNQATRLLRYRTGDAAVAQINDGRVTSIEQLTGRWGREFLVGKNGTRLTMTALNVHNDMLNAVRRYQFVQHEPGRCTLRLMPTTQLGPQQCEQIVNVFQRKVGDELDIRGEVVKEIPLTTRGKHQFIVALSAGGNL